jgi:DNA-binding beta-propeller fold protein YncE
MRKTSPLACSYLAAAISLLSCLPLRANEGTVGEIRTVAGNGSIGNDGNGSLAINARLNQPFGICFGPRNEMYIADAAAHCVRVVQPDGKIHAFAGCGIAGYAGDGGAAEASKLSEPYAVACDRAGNVFIADRLNACVRFVQVASGKIFTMAGTGKPGYSGDGGISTMAQLKEPNGLALDDNGHLLIADVADNRIRSVNLNSGTITTVAGTGEQSDDGDGDVASRSALNGARAVAAAPNGNLYICERSGHRIREIEHKIGIIRTIAGTGKPGYGGDGKSAVLASFNGPKWVALAPDKTLFVVDTENNVVRKIADATGVVTTVAGCGQRGGEGDGGSAIKAKLNRPHGCCIHEGVLYIADSENHRVRAVHLRADRQ